MPPSLMASEAAESGEAVARLLSRNHERFTQLACALVGRPPALVVTCARGSSDHAATYAKYLIEAFLGVQTASAAPSVASLLAGRIAHGEHRLCLAISQSGRSPDLLAAVAAQREAGAHIAAFVNDEDAPLFSLADTGIPLCAGQERSVAATKSYICSLAAIALLAALWSGDEALERAARSLPQDLRRAYELDWSAALPIVSGTSGMFVLGRGYGLAVAQEAALKLKETCGIQAEAFSSAEVRHGPMAIVGEGFPVLAFVTPDEAGEDVRHMAHMLGERGARVMMVYAEGGEAALPALPAHPAIAPVLMIQSFYRFVEQLARLRGRDPDAPPHLQKVTSTL